jgi:hypothetical protein
MTRAISSDAGLSTAQVAKLLHIHVVTLERWLNSGAVPGPALSQVGARLVRIWTIDDLERVKKFKESNYPRRPGRKARSGGKEIPVS